MKLITLMVALALIVVVIIIYWNYPIEKENLTVNEPEPEIPIETKILKQFTDSTVNQPFQPSIATMLDPLVYTEPNIEHQIIPFINEETITNNGSLPLPSVVSPHQPDDFYKIKETCRQIAERRCQLDNKTCMLNECEIGSPRENQCSNNVGSQNSCLCKGIDNCKMTESNESNCSAFVSKFC